MMTKSSAYSLARAVAASAGLAFAIMGGIAWNTYDGATPSTSMVARLPSPIAVYLGAKSVVTGYDHIIFFIGMMYPVAKPNPPLPTLLWFMLGPVIAGIAASIFGHFAGLAFIQIIVANSITSIALANVNAFQVWFGSSPNRSTLTIISVFFHGICIMSHDDIQRSIAEYGLIDMALFLIGTASALLMLSLISSIVVGHWRRHARYGQISFSINFAILIFAACLTGIRITDLLMGEVA